MVLYLLYNVTVTVELNSIVVWVRQFLILLVGSRQCDIGIIEYLLRLDMVIVRGIYLLLKPLGLCYSSSLRLSIFLRARAIPSLSYMCYGCFFFALLNECHESHYHRHRWSVTPRIISSEKPACKRGTSKDVNTRSSPSSLASTKQELHVLWRQLLHGDLVVIDGTVDHVGLLFLEHDHPRFNGIFDTKSSDNTRTLLADTMATISRLPFCCRVPPSMGDMRSVYSVHRWRRMKASGDLRIDDEHP